MGNLRCSVQYDITTLRKATAMVHPRNLQKLQSETESSHTVRLHDVVHYKYIWCGENKEGNSSTQYHQRTP